MLPLGAIYIILSITQTSEATKSKGLTCESDYWLTINCFLNFTVIPNRTENTLYRLEFRFREISDDIMTFNCTLTKGEDGYTCTFKARNFSHFTTFTSSINFAVNLCYPENGLNNCLLLDPKFYPAKHIKPIKPQNLTLGLVGGNYSFRWISGYEEHTYVTSLPLRYKFSYQKVLHPDSTLTLQLHQTVQCTIPEDRLEPGIQYIAWVCTEIITSKSYNGVGSSCSSPIKWSTTQKASALPIEDPIAALLQSTAGIVTLICLGAMALIFMLLCPAVRLKIKKITWVATPSPYFLSLFQNHQGNFKDWVSKGEDQQIYSEEISKIDMMTEIRAEKNCHHKFSSMYSSEQYHTPYISPAAEVWAPFQVIETQSVDSFSCKDLDFLPEEPAAEEPAMLCLTMFEPITVESFLCMDDLEFSQEDLEPPEPETTALKPATFPQNYCTLTNTSTGFIPTLTTGPCSHEIAADASEESLTLQANENTEELVPLTLDSLQLSMDE